MNEKQHSVTPPSSMNIFINCPAALKLSEGFEDKSGPAAEEGTEAHALCEFLIRSELGEEVDYFMAGYVEKQEDEDDEGEKSKKTVYKLDLVNVATNRKSEFVAEI